METAFIVFRLVRGKRLPIGFAEDVFDSGASLHILAPFTRHRLFTSQFGDVECRGVWVYPRVLPAEDYRARPHPIEPWMMVEESDLLAAIELCERLDAQLPSDGFSRFRKQ